MDNAPSNICARCGKHFESQHSLYFHTKNCTATLSNIKCSKCQQSFPTMRLLTLHLQEFHTDRAVGIGSPIPDSNLDNNTAVDLGNLPQPDNQHDEQQEYFFHNANNDAELDTDTGPLVEFGPSPIAKRKRETIRSRVTLYDETHLSFNQDDLFQSDGNVDHDDIFGNDNDDSSEDSSSSESETQKDNDSENMVYQNIILAASEEDAAEESANNVQSETSFDEQMSDKTLLEMLDKYKEKGIDLEKDDPQFACQVDLLRILERKGVPLGCYDDIMKWSFRSAVTHGYKFDKEPQFRKKIVKDLLNNTDLKGMIPEVIEFELPNSKQKVTITTHNVRHAIYSLLNDPDLMKEENLIFRENPFEEPIFSNVSEYKDINDGKAYFKAYICLCTEKGKDVLCPIIFFIDKTHTDAKGNQTLEPVCITLGIFNLACRNREDAWRIIGYIPNQSTIRNKRLSSDEKNADYHAMLNVVIAPVAKLQASNGILWDLNYRGTTYRVNFKIPVLFICGDSEGQDKLVGRRIRYHSLGGEQQICRYCDVPYDQTDNPEYKSRPTKQRKIETWLRQNNTDALHNIGYMNIKKCTSSAGIL